MNTSQSGRADASNNTLRADEGIFYSSDDLDVAETDAREAYTKLLHMVEQAEPSQAHPDRNPAVRELFEEVEDRLEYLVKRKVSYPDL